MTRCGEPRLTATAAAVCASIALVLLTLAAPAFSQEEVSLVYTGSAVDSSGEPVAAAAVRLYETTLNSDNTNPAARLVAETTADAKGRWRITATHLQPGPTGEKRVLVTLLASSDNLALGWLNLLPGTRPEGITLVLEPPSAVEGTVVDEKGAPVPSADVAAVLLSSGDRGQILIGVPPIVALRTKTSASGRFAFHNLASDSIAGFLLSAPDKAYSCALYEAALRRPTGIRLVLPAQAVIEGVAVDKTTGVPVPGLDIVAENPDSPTPNPFHKPSATSAKDGRFRIDRLVPASYVLKLAPPDGIPEWIADSPLRRVEAGQTVSIRFPVERPGILEIAVVEAGAGKPVPEVNITIRKETGEYQGGVEPTGEDGLSTVRLPSGRYSISSVWKMGYTQLAGLPEVQVTPGATQKVTIEMEAPYTLSGRVRDDSGSPVPGARVTALAGGLYWEAASGEDGRFEIPLSPFSASRELPPVSVVARDEGRNLAGVAAVSDPSAPLNLKVSPATSATGRVLDASRRPIAGARVSLFLITESGAVNVTSNAALAAGDDGRYAIPSIPGEYACEVRVSAAGYGQGKAVVMQPGPAFESLNMPEIILGPANNSIGGTVLDARGKGVSGVYIYASMPGQEMQMAVSDPDGRFLFDSLVDGPVELTAQAAISGARFSARLNAATGDSDAKLVLRQDSSSPSSGGAAALAGRPVPSLKDLSPSLDVSGADGRPLLICFFDSSQRPSRHLVNELSRTAADLQSRGLFILALELSGAAEDAPDGGKSPLPIARIEGNAEAALAPWDIRGLPWMVLADANHTVLAEGFSLEALDSLLDKAGVAPSTLAPE